MHERIRLVANEKNQPSHSGDSLTKKVISMRRLGDIVTTPPRWVNSRHSIEVAVALMEKFHLDVLPVVDNDVVVGAVDARQLLSADPSSRVSDVMRRDVLLLEGETPVRAAAMIMAQNGQDVAFVVEDDELVGIVKLIELVPEISRSFDPLTQLPWQDALREWSIDKLRTGHEISIIFFDIDRFGQFNKNYDHVTGDRVLEQVARTIERELDPDLTILCRYGGDEFAVATLYMIDEAQHLAARIARRVEEIQLPHVRETISVSYGVFGGRRTREREDVHYAATVDDLIVRASRLCLQMKQRKGSLAMLQLPLFTAEAEERVAPRIQVTGISYVAQGKQAQASVELTMGGTRVHRQVSGDAKQPAEELMVQAARDALLELVPNLGAVEIQSVSKVTVNLQERNEQVDGVMVAVELKTLSGTQLLFGVAPVRENLYRTAVNALLHALNRHLAKTPAPAGKQLSM
jgi:diguanylate cyclase (GGDEF)-like protein